MTNPKNYSLVLSFAVILTLIVIVLGAYTRLTDSGLGCPDWPGCYAQLGVPENVSTDEFQRPIVKHKAWNEMIHRNVAGTLGFVVLLILFMTVKGRNALKQSIGLTLLLLATVIFMLLLCLRLIKVGGVMSTLAKILLVVLVYQVSLGIMNVMLGLPIAVATLHTLFAALLLLLLLTTLAITHRIIKS